MSRRLVGTALALSLAACTQIHSQAVADKAAPEKPVAAFNLPSRPVPHRLPVRANRSTRATYPVHLRAGAHDVWWRLSQCESPTGRNSSDGLYHGYFQFLVSTWQSIGAPGVPEQWPYSVQKHWAQVLASVANPYHQWPVCWPRAQ